MSDTRYPNQIPINRRSGYFNKDSYDSGVIRDGHKVYIEEGDICVEHPPECERRVEESGGIRFLGGFTNCLWYLAEDMGVDECYCLGSDELDRGRLSDEPVEVNWSFVSGASWTDYGWEYDATLSWWFPGDPDMQEPEA